MDDDLFGAGSGEHNADIDIETEESDKPAMIHVDETSDVDDIEPTPLLTLAGALGSMQSGCVSLHLQVQTSWAVFHHVDMIKSIISTC